MQLSEITYIALAAVAMMTGVEGRGIGRAGGKAGGRTGGKAGKAAEHAGNAAGAAGTASSFVPAGGDHSRHNCCRNAGSGWVLDDWAKSLTATACGNYDTAQLIDGVCVEAAGYSISGDSFFESCRALAPGDKNVGAGYRGTC
ncbi:hypothetical protein T440DRAFT_522930 [Plenodomus tracheiphilus IPT5]|uniref:Uncharacterized protein n=1 Tax=Plenodomus tracheiphilus IPT5 TaxID=1408161 RepID=A0A6A7APV7_9PLEO|nr:hypothetical protein T440DRAFT_522930 [Plenodomus tracheiphilus IPT5]